MTDTHKNVGERFGVNQSTVTRIVNKKRRYHIL